MTGKRRSNAQLARDRKRVAELYLKGWLQVDIAQELNVNQSTISRDLAYLIEEWQAVALYDFNEARARELAKINLLEETYWAEWLTSKDPIVKRKTAKKVDGQTTEATQEVSLGTGDPRFLQGVQWCIDRRCKLLGLDTQTGDSDEKPFIIKVLKGVSMSDL
jgi:hypothetical protein